MLSNYFLSVLVLLKAANSFKILYPNSGSSFQRGSQLNVTVKSVQEITKITVFLDSRWFCEINQTSKDQESECCGTIFKELHSTSCELFALGMQNDGQIIRSNSVLINILRPTTEFASLLEEPKRILVWPLKPVPERWAYKTDCRKLVLFDVDGTVTEARQVRF